MVTAWRAVTPVTVCRADTPVTVWRADTPVTVTVTWRATHMITT